MDHTAHSNGDKPEYLSYQTQLFFSAGTRTLQILIITSVLLFLPNSILRWP